MVTWTIFDGMNLAFHEMGHAAFMWFGSRMLAMIASIATAAWVLRVMATEEGERRKAYEST